MHKLFATRGFTNLPRWQITVCLLLVVLVVYNPYLAGLESCANICIRHAPSNRATVGACELQHFTPGNRRSVFGAAAVGVFEYFDELAPPTRSWRRSMPEAVFVSVQFRTASLWFRPPPGV
jgi:hypothetical protein